MNTQVNIMPKNKLKISNKFYLKAIFIAVMALWLASCATQQAQKEKPVVVLTQDTISQLNQLQQKAQTAREPQKSQYWLEFARILTQAQDYETAILAFNKINLNYLSKNQAWIYFDYATQAALAIDDAWAALGFIEKVTPKLTDINQSQKKSLQYKKALAYEKVARFESSTRAYYYASAFESNLEQKQKLEASLWKNLLRIAKNKIQQLAVTEPNKNLKGWFELALIRQEATISLPELQSRLNSWLRRWANHSAAKNLPYDLKLLQELSKNPIENFAFFVPFSGNYAASANAIINGFMSVYYSKPSYKRNKIKINFYDTQENSISSLYRQAKADGAQVVIGPLDKNMVDKVANYSNLPLPTLALNYGNSKIYADNLIEYGLSAEDEAKQAAQYAWQNGLRSALIIVVADSWGQRVRKAFSDEWLKLGGTIADTSLINANSNISNSVEDLLEVTAGKRRRASLVREINVKVEYEPYYRKDADFIFLHTDNKKAKQVMPSLKYLKAAKLPVIATSAVYQIPYTAQNDLNGLIFCDLPWYLEASDGLKRQIASLWRETFVNFGRLYAMGIDAYKLAELLPLLHEISETNIQGVTGLLSQEDSKIFRSLPWAKFVNGYSNIINSENLKQQNQAIE